MTIKGSSFAAALMMCCVFGGASSAADLYTSSTDQACMSPATLAGLSGAQLASAIGANVAANPSCAQNSCNIGSGVTANLVSSNSSQSAVITPVSSGARAIGAGLAQAYHQFASAGDSASADEVARAGCGCGGGVTSGFTSSAGSQACLPNYGGETSYGGSGTVGSLFYIRALGGGGGAPQSNN